MRSSFALVFASLALGAGCHEPPTEPAGRYVRPAGLVPIATHADGPSRHPLGSMSAAQMEAFVQAETAISDVLDAPDAGWQEVDRQLRPLLAANARHPWANETEQFVGSVMLRGRLLRLPPSTERDEAIAYYTDLLVRNRHEDAGVLADALTALKGVWPEGRIREAAATAREAGERYLQRNGACPQGLCKNLAEVKRGLGAEGTDLVSRVVTGLDRLDAL